MVRKIVIKPKSECINVRKVNLYEVSMKILLISWLWLFLDIPLAESIVIDVFIESLGDLDLQLKIMGREDYERCT